MLWTRNGACVVYPSHAIIVSMEISTGHQRFFIGHTDKVPLYLTTCLLASSSTINFLYSDCNIFFQVSAITFNGNTSILASGQLGQSTVIRIWRYHSGDSIAIFNSQVRSLHCLRLSQDFLVFISDLNSCRHIRFASSLAVFPTAAEFCAVVVRTAMENMLVFCRN